MTEAKTEDKQGIFLKVGKYGVPIQSGTLLAVLAFGFGAVKEAESFTQTLEAVAKAQETSTKELEAMKLDFQKTNQTVAENSKIRPELEALRSKHEADMKEMKDKIEQLQKCVRSKLKRCDVY